MTQDWKDMLAGLAGKVPEAPAGEETAVSPDSSEAVVQKGALRVLLDKKGRKGKVATIIEGFEIDDTEVEKLASELKRKIGTGGSSRGGEILLQGDWRQKVIDLLKEKGYAAC